MDVLTGEESLVRRPGSRSRREALLVMVAAAAVVVTALVMLVGIVMLVTEPWSSPEPPILLTVVMVEVPVTTLAVAYVAAIASRRARDPRDVLTDREIAAAPMAVAGPWLEAREAVRVVRAAPGHDSAREREISEMLWKMAEHLKTGAHVYTRLPVATVDQVNQVNDDLLTAMQALADQLTALSSKVGGDRLEPIEGVNAWA
ncbi:hypothetical protein [Rhodococcus sp. PvR044]|uniref:hypothetical protein n=1 Tax=Rhodococcus sp. PvR044 TaxID=3156402 RepID=UPI0033941B82